MTMEKIPMTAAGHAALEAELKRRTSEERPRIIEAIAEARGHGDLSENAEYHAAKEAQGLNEGRIAELEDQLSRAEIIDVIEADRPKTIKFGATVTLVDEDTEEKKKYQIVGDVEADVKDGRISISSPIARALIGKAKGDTVEVDRARRRALLRDPRRQVPVGPDTIRRSTSPGGSSRRIRSSRRPASALIVRRDEPTRQGHERGLAVPAGLVEGTLQILADGPDRQARALPLFREAPPPRRAAPRRRIRDGRGRRPRERAARSTGKAASGWSMKMTTERGSPMPGPSWPSGTSRSESGRAPAASPQAHPHRARAWRGPVSHAAPAIARRRRCASVRRHRRERVAPSAMPSAASRSARAAALAASTRASPSQTSAAPRKASSEGVLPVRPPAGDDLPGAERDGETEMRHERCDDAGVAGFESAAPLPAADIEARSRRRGRGLGEDAVSPAERTDQFVVVRRPHVVRVRHQRRSQHSLAAAHSVGPRTVIVEFRLPRMEPQELALIDAGGGEKRRRHEGAEDQVIGPDRIAEAGRARRPSHARPSAAP